MSDPHASLRAFTEALHPLEEAVWSDFLACWQPARAARKEILTRAGSTEPYLYFVLDGVQRAVYRHNDRDYTLVFSYAPSFSGIVDSFLNRSAARYDLEALTASSFLRIHYNDFMRLVAQYPSLEQWMRIALSRVLEGTLERQSELLALNAEEKFTILLRRSPHLLQLIPHKYIASYIGVDATTFSKLMGSVRL